MTPTATPAITRAAAEAVARCPHDPAAAVSKTLAAEVGVPLKGWIGHRGTWWREHSTQVWAGVVALDTALQLFQQDIPAEWTRVGHWVAVAGGITGTVLKYRVQAGLVLERIREALRSKA